MQSEKTSDLKSHVLSWRQKGVYSELTLNDRIGLVEVKVTCTYCSYLHHLQVDSL